jgi:AcrR family transcriptional regulator
MTQAENQREARKRDTRARILTAAAALYLARGLDGVSIDEVAQAAGRTKGAVYGHFADKEAMLLEVWRAHYAEKRVWIERALALADDPVAMFAELERAMAAVFALGPWPALAVDVRRRADYARLAAELAALERGELAAMAAPVEATLARLGVAPALPADELADTLFALAEGLLLRPDLAPEAAAARFMLVLRRLVGFDAPPCSPA